MKKNILTFLSLTCLLFTTLHAQVLPDGNFELGIGTASTGLTPACGAPQPGRYCIGTNALSFGNQFLNVTPCQGTQMMCVDGATVPTLVWGQTATGLVVGCTYNLRFCIRAISGTGNANFINATAYGMPIPGLSNLGTTNAWVSVTGTFTATSVTAPIQINQIGVALPGFDFAIDDIRLVSNCANTVCQTICKANDKDNGQRLIKTTSNDVIVTGTLFETGSVDQDMYSAKLNSTLALAGVNTARRVGDFGSVRTENGFAITQASDGFIYAAGSVEISPGLNDVLVAKLDPITMAAIWIKQYGTPSTNENATVILESDINPTNNKVNLVVAGNRSVNGVFDAFAFKIDSDGLYNALGTILYSGPTGTNEFVYNGLKTSASGGEIVLVGEQSVAANNSDFLIFRILVSNLQLASATSYFTGKITATSFESITGVAEIGSTLYFSGLAKYVGNNSGFDIMIAKTINTFTTANTPTLAIFGKTTTTTSDEIATDIAVTGDNNIVISGSKIDQSGTLKDGLVVKVNVSSLTVMWSKALSGAPGTYSNNDTFNDVVKMNSNQLALVGHRGSSATDEDIFVSLINPDGSGCCYADYPLNKLSPLCSISSTLTKTNTTYTTSDYLNESPYYCTNSLCSQVFPMVLAPDEITPSNKFDTFDFNQNVAKATLKVQPNPSAHDVLFSFELSEGEYGKTIEVYSMNGNRIYVSELKSDSRNHQWLPESSITTGVYVVKLITNRGVHEQRLIREE
jgi:hypothetical protein